MKKFKVNVWSDIPKWFKRAKMVNKRYNSRDYYNVYLFDTYEEMYKYVEKIEGCADNDYAGRTWCFTKAFFKGEKIVKYSPHCGNIYLCTDNIHISTICHECNHAVIGYFNRRISKYEEIFDKAWATDEDEPTHDYDHEELFCYMSGFMMSNVSLKIAELLGM